MAGCDKDHTNRTRGFQDRCAASMMYHGAMSERDRTLQLPASSPRVQGLDVRRKTLAVLVIRRCNHQLHPARRMRDTPPSHVWTPHSPINYSYSLRRPGSAWPRARRRSARCSRTAKACQLEPDLIERFRQPGNPHGAGGSQSEAQATSVTVRIERRRTALPQYPDYSEVGNSRVARGVSARDAPTHRHAKICPSWCRMMVNSTPDSSSARRVTECCRMGV